MSTGLASVNVATYSTLPRALRGARSRSWMIALCGSFGSISPCTLPRISSNDPAAPAGCPLFIGSRAVISRRIACAPAVGAESAMAAAAIAALTGLRIIRYLQGQQQGAQTLAVRVERQRSRHA